jgi:hypothetical protein
VQDPTGTDDVPGSVGKNDAVNLPGNEVRGTLPEGLKNQIVLSVIRDHQYRDMLTASTLTDQTADFESVHARQKGVEKDGIGPPVEKSFHCFFTVFRLVNGVSLSDQDLAYELTQVRLVYSDQNIHRIF